MPQAGHRDRDKLRDRGRENFIRNFHNGRSRAKFPHKANPRLLSATDKPPTPKACCTSSAAAVSSSSLLLVLRKVPRKVPAQGPASDSECSMDRVSSSLLAAPEDFIKKSGLARTLRTYMAKKQSLTVSVLSVIYHIQ
jgi:hypothetical protein